jgi:hypothetical protein
MIVRAFSSAVAGVDDESTIPVLRAEAISRDVFIALFAGQPKRIHIREPFEGVRFGVESKPNGGYEVDQRTVNGDVLNGDETITLRSQTLRTIDVLALRNQLNLRGMGDPRGVALHLEQRPFVQIFLDSVPEPAGSVLPPQNLQVPLRNGKLFTLQFATQALFKLDV